MKTRCRVSWGVGANQAIVTVGVANEDVISAAFSAIGKRGIVVLTSLANPASKRTRSDAGCPGGIDL